MINIFEGLNRVLPFLLNVISHHSQQQDGNFEAVLQACKCVKAWVQFGVPMESCDVIVDTLLSCVNDEELQEQSCNEDLRRFGETIC